jgi:hypothetical protein
VAEVAPEEGLEDGSEPEPGRERDAEGEGEGDGVGFVREVGGVGREFGREWDLTDFGGVGLEAAMGEEELPGVQGVVLADCWPTVGCEREVKVDGCKGVGRGRGRFGPSRRWEAYMYR